MIKATHIKSGRTGRILDEVPFGRFWFEQDFNSDGTVSGWYYTDELTIPGVNAPESKED